MLLDPEDWSLAQRSDDVLPQLPDGLAGARERRDAPGRDRARDRPARDASATRSRSSRTCARGSPTSSPSSGLAVAAAGTHPIALWSETRVSPASRYQVILRTMADLARREPTFALHVHVGVPDPERAIRLLNQLRAHLPLLLGLSANSPFWQGRSTGLASTRTSRVRRVPAHRAPAALPLLRGLGRTVDTLLRCGAFPEPTFLWWDIRPQPALGTVEVRVMDAQTDVGATAALVALVQSLARLELEEGYAPEALVGAEEMLDENRFLAARDGIEADLLDPAAELRRPARAQLRGAARRRAPARRRARLPRRARAASRGSRSSRRSCASSTSPSAAAAPARAHGRAGGGVRRRRPLSRTSGQRAARPATTRVGAARERVARRTAPSRPRRSGRRRRARRRCRSACRRRRRCARADRRAPSSPARRRAIAGSSVRSSASEPKPPWPAAKKPPSPARSSLSRATASRLPVTSDRRTPSRAARSASTRSTPGASRSRRSGGHAAGVGARARGAEVGGAVVDPRRRSRRRGGRSRARSRRPCARRRARRRGRGRRRPTPRAPRRRARGGAPRGRAGAAFRRCRRGGARASARLAGVACSRARSARERDDHRGRFDRSWRRERPARAERNATGVRPKTFLARNP